MLSRKSLLGAPVVNLEVIDLLSVCDPRQSLDSSILAENGSRMWWCWYMEQTMVY